MMRYSINENGNNDKALLTHEIKQIRNLIELYNKQSINQLYINFSVIGNADFRRINPMSLILFVEKSLNFAMIENAEYPLSIIVEINANKLDFIINFCVNEKFRHENLTSSFESIYQNIMMQKTDIQLFNLNNSSNQFSFKTSFLL